MNLDIPKQFARARTSRPRRLRQVKTRWVLPALACSRKPPRGWATAVQVRVHLRDECPRIGAGYRTIWAAPGRKWVRICDHNNNRGKLTLAQFAVVRA
jgi:hypothetical protein